MPYAAAADIPAHLHGLSLDEANRWAAVYDARRREGDSEEKAARVAWGALRKADEIAGVADEDGTVYPVVSFLLPVGADEPPAAPRPPVPLPPLTGPGAFPYDYPTEIADLCATWERCRLAHDRASVDLVSDPSAYTRKLAAAVLLWLHLGDRVPALWSRDTQIVGGDNAPLYEGEILACGRLITCETLARALRAWRLPDGDAPIWFLDTDQLLEAARGYGLTPLDPDRMMACLRYAVLPGVYRGVPDEPSDGAVYLLLGERISLIPNAVRDPRAPLLAGGDGLTGDLFDHAEDDLAVGAWLAALRATLGGEATP